MPVTAVVIERRTSAAVRSVVPGTIFLTLVAFLLAFSRWGSYVSVPFVHQFYVTEFALAAVLVAIGVTRSAPAMLQALLRWPRWLSLPLLALLFWSAIRLVTGPLPSVDALRDAAPFGYLAASAAAVLPVRGRIANGLVVAACVLHTAWFTISLYWPDSVQGLPRIGATRLFEIRTDVDAMLCGVAAAVFIVCAVRARRRSSSIVLGLLAVHNLRMLVTVDNRAGLLAGGAALAVAVAVCFRSMLVSRNLTRRQLASSIALALVLFVSAVALVVTRTAAGRRFMGTFGHQVDAATGTRDARLLTYQLVIDYVRATPGRTLFGVGFGPDFLHLSGGDKPLEGTEFTGVRSPHMFLLGTWARLGLVGAVLELVVVLAVVVLAAYVILRRPQLSLLTILALGLVLAIPIAAAIGVVLESPFGAVPYAWAIGTLAQAACSPTAPPDQAQTLGGSHR